MATDVAKHMTRTQLEAEVNRLMELVEESRNVDVSRSGTQIVLPEAMSYDEGIKWLQKRQKEQETVIRFRHTTKAVPQDGAYAFYRAIMKIYGFTQQLPTVGFFSTTPPMQLNVRVGPRRSDVVQVPWGKLELPGIEGTITTFADLESGQPQFGLIADIKAKSKPQLVRLCSEMDRFVAEESIYKGKAIGINFAFKREGLDYNPDVHAPRYMDLDGIKRTDLIVNELTDTQLDTTLFSFIDNADKLRANNIPIKRGILLEGVFGVGKTLTASVTARKAVDAGFTFILCEDARDLADTVRFSRAFEPVVIFCEDIDRVVLKERTLTVDDLLNVIDGIESKRRDLIIVLTTNHVEQLGKALLRPGRLDSIVSMQLPDAATAARLVKHYGGKNLAKEADVQLIGTKLQGLIPAVIREVVERAKVATIARMASKDIDGCVTTKDLEVAEVGMKRHLELLSDRPVELINPAITYMETLAEVTVDRMVTRVLQSPEFVDTLSTKVAEKL